MQALDIVCYSQISLIRFGIVKQHVLCLIFDYHLPNKYYIPDTAWINVQKKHEFNPVHNHTGLFSFVIWLDIPYNINDELANGPGKQSNNNLAGHFEFAFRNTLGEHTTVPIPVDKTFNGKICIFPSAMPHTVYPFYTSNDYRITVSGNVNFSE